MVFYRPKALHPAGPHVTGLSGKYSHQSEFWKKQKTGYQNQCCFSFLGNLLSYTMWLCSSSLQTSFDVSSFTAWQSIKHFYICVCFKIIRRNLVLEKSHFLDCTEDGCWQTPATDRSIKHSAPMRGCFGLLIDWEIPKDLFQT